MELPKEMIEEFLIRMPVKSVIKFKCVSKDWNKYLSGPRFRKLYQSQHRRTYPCGFFYYTCKSLFFSQDNACMSAKFINFSNIEKEEQALHHDIQELGYVVGCSNGLLLLCHKFTNYHVYDLLTRKKVKLPEPQNKYKKYVSTGFICNEREHDCTNNINTTSSYLTYKIVRVGFPIPYDEKFTHEVETYSSETGKWHKSTMTAALKFCVIRSTSIVIGGVIHWKNSKGSITAYNPEDPAGRAILIEVPTSADFLKSTITGTKDRLIICVSSISCDIHLWFLETKYKKGSYLDEDIVDRNRWTRFREIRFVELKRSLHDILPSRHLFAIAIHPQDSNVIFIQTIGTNALISYNLNEKSVEAITPIDEQIKTFCIDLYFHFEWSSWPCL